MTLTPRRAGALLLLMAAGLFALVFVTTPLELDAQASLGAALLTAALLLGFIPARIVTLLLIALSVLVSSRYVYFRVTSTWGAAELSLGWILGLGVLGAEMYSYAMLLFGYVSGAWPLGRKPLSLPSEVSIWPTVDVFIPTYNEPLYVVAPTILAARALDWPVDKLRVYVLDDGCRPELQHFARAVGVGYFARADNAHGKAGSINKVLGKTAGEVIVVFDCDQVPTRSFLQLSMGWLMRDERLAFVQTRRHCYSPDPFEKNLATFRRQPSESELFYGVTQRGNDLWNAASLCGSCALIRRSALDEVGGIATETGAEDLHTALRLHRRGFHSAYIAVPQMGGLATESLSAYVGQRQRWARGMAQILRTDNPLLGRGLSLTQRLCYAASLLHYFQALPRLVFLLAPVGYLCFGKAFLCGAPLLWFVHALPHWLHCHLTQSRLQGRYRWSFWSAVYETTLAPFVALPALLALFSFRRGAEDVPAQGGPVDAAYFDRQLVWPQLLLAAVNVAGFVASLWPWSAHGDAALLCAGFCLYNLMILGAALAVAREVQQRRGAPRMAAHLHVAVMLGSGHALQAETCDLSLTGARLRVGHLTAQANGTPLSVCWLDADRMAIPARVIKHEADQLQLRWDELSIPAYTALVEHMFSRADAWSDWDRERRSDRPWLELLRIVFFGVRGLRYAALSPFTRARP
jgi:cellulose synthase (UDP-forming)